MSSNETSTATPSSSSSSSDEEELRKLLKPNPSTGDILKVLRNSYYTPQDNATNDDDGIKIMKQLESYDDCNYLIEMNQTKYIVKIHNGVESSHYINKKKKDDDDDGRHIDLMKKIYFHLNKAEFKVTTSLPMPTTNKSEKSNDDDDGYSTIHKLPVVSPSHPPQPLVVQLLQYIDGIPMSSCTALSIETLASAGVYLGRVCTALDNLSSTDDQATSIAKSRNHAWDGQHTMDLQKFVQYIKREDRRDMVQSVLNEFEKVFVEGDAAKEFRCGILQGDFNDANIIMEDGVDGKVAGVIDFGDSVFSWRVLDITVAMTYSMLSVYGKANRGLAAAAAMLRGFHSVYPLTPHEQKYLRLLIAARLSCSATLGAYSYHMNPENEYLLLHAEPAWMALDLVWGQCCKNPDMALSIDNLFLVACNDTISSSSSSDGIINCTDISMPDPSVVDLLENVRSKKGSVTEEPPAKRLKTQEDTSTKPTITFVTGNKKKLEEVKRILHTEVLPFALTNHKVDLPELQGDPLKIAKEKCALAAKEINGAVITEDTSLCFTALNNLPGPYIKWFLDDCGHDGLNNMISFSDDKSGYAQTVVAFCPGPGQEIVVFDGRTKGIIVPPRGKLDFGWDPIFQPDEGGGLTYAEMTKEGKDAISHRSRAFSQLREYFSKEMESIKTKIK